MDRCASVNQTALIALCLMAFCGLLALTTPVWADPPQDDQFQTDQFQDDQPQIARPKHKPNPVVHRIDPAVQLRHNLRDKINMGQVLLSHKIRDRVFI